nr:putative reverse transcriptase domain-containing protein [Tanacetum cinerariifolium]
MFEHHVEDNIWKHQQGLVKVLKWKLYDSCRVYCVTMQFILYYLLVEKMYSLTNHTLHQMWNDVKLQVDYECEMAYDLLRLVRKQLKEGCGKIIGIKRLFDDLKVTATKSLVCKAQDAALVEGVVFVKRLTPHIGATLLAISSSLNPLLDLYDLLGCLMNEFWTIELSVFDIGLTNRLGESIYNYPYGIVSTLRPWELGDKIYGDIVSLPLWNLGLYQHVRWMDWLSLHDAIIVCGKKEVHVPLKKKTLVVKGDDCVSRLKVVSCMKVKKYVDRGCYLFVTQFIEKEPTERRLEEVPVIFKFPDVFPKDLPGLPPPRQVEFKIELVPGDAPVALFMDLMNRECRSFLDKYVIVFIDDILIYSKNKEEHEEHLRIIPELLQKEKLYAKFSKCEFWLDSVKFLGHMINSQGVHVDPTEVEAIKNWTALKTPTKKDPKILLYTVMLCKRLWSCVDAAREAHFLPKKKTDSFEKLAELYLKEIVFKHGVPMSVISDKDSLFTLRFWVSLQKALGTQLDLSTAYHPETDGQSERTIQTLEDMLRTCVIDFGSSWDKHLLSRQKSYPDLKRRLTEFEVGDKVILKVSPWRGVIRFGNHGKLSSRFIGPFKVIERIGPVAYKLEFPDKLRGIHDTFHVSNIKRCFVNDEVAIPLDKVQLDDKLYFVEEPVEIMDREVKQLKQSRIPIIKVRWNSRRGPKFTWEREDFFRSKYPQIFIRRRVTRQGKRRDVAS